MTPECHTCGLQTSISYASKTISHARLTNPDELFFNTCIIRKIKFNIPENNPKRCLTLSQHTKMSSVKKSSEHLRTFSATFRKSSGKFGNSGHDKTKSLRIWLRNSWQVYKLTLLFLTMWVYNHKLHANYWHLMLIIPKYMVLYPGPMVRNQRQCCAKTQHSHHLKKSLIGLLHLPIFCYKIKQSKDLDRYQVSVINSPLVEYSKLTSVK